LVLLGSFTFTILFQASKTKCLPVSSTVVLPLLSYAGVVDPLIAVIWFWLLNVRDWLPDRALLVQLPRASSVQLLVGVPAELVSSVVPLCPLLESVPRENAVSRVHKLLALGLSTCCEAFLPEML
jgi:hypothetical protein